MEKLDRLLEMKNNGEKIEFSHVPQSFQQILKLFQKKYKEEQRQKLEETR